MKSRVPPSGYGADPSAQGSSRPAGMLLGQWLNAKVGQPDQVSAPAIAQPQPASLASSGQDIAEIHRRLDSITQQINELSPGRGSAPATAAAAGGLANQLNDAISRLDSRLARLSQPPPRPAPPPATELPPPPAFAAPRPVADTFDLGSAVAEIAARRGELDGSPYRQSAPRP